MRTHPSILVHSAIEHFLSGTLRTPTLSEDLTRAVGIKTRILKASAFNRLSESGPWTSESYKNREDRIMNNVNYSFVKMRDAIGRTMRARGGRLCVLMRKGPRLLLILFLDIDSAGL